MSRAEIEAISDGLTGLYNHRYLHERLAEEIERAREQKTAISLLFCNLDHFKQFNEARGHSSGDKALRNVAHVLEQAIRRIDLAARFGGEEFVLVLIEPLSTAPWRWPSASARTSTRSASRSTTTPSPSA